MNSGKGFALLEKKKVSKFLEVIEMKKIIIALNIVLLTVFFAVAQDKTANTDSPAEKVLIASGTHFDAKLVQTLDVKKAEIGDEVVFKTTESVKQNGEVVIPKGTRLVGRITEVQRKTRENAVSKIAVVFERLENKNLSIPVNAGIVSIVDIATNARSGGLFETDAAGNSRSTATSPSSRKSSGGTGLLGGTTGAVGSIVNTTTETVGGVTDTVGNTAGRTTGALGRTSNGIRIIRTADVSATGSTTLSVENENLRLQKGTSFQIRLNESVKKVEQSEEKSR